MKDWIRNIVDEMSRKLVPALERRSKTSLLLLGDIRAQQTRALPPTADLRDAGFRVFSQSDEDGILQFLTRHVPVVHRTFIEFGVENYEEATTRFLLEHDDWQGLVLDGSKSNIAHVKNTELSWRHDLQAAAAFVTCENINELIRAAEFDPDVGLLSIDIDGNDYWVWEAIDSIRPRLVACEFNNLFGLAPVSVPYDPAFQRTRAHHSNLYFGCSLAALEHLAGRKGYRLVGVNKMGHNAFFVRSDLAGPFPLRTARDCYFVGNVRESRDREGHLTFARKDARQALIANEPVVDVITGERLALRDALQRAL